MTASILVTGGSGQLATALAEAAPMPGMSVCRVGRPALDFDRPASIAEVFAAAAPALVVNAAAYTAVDAAEDDADAAFRANRDGPAELARLCQAAAIPLIHVSTDYVFDGQSSRAYRPDDAPAPRTVYGASKLAGEIAVQEVAPEALILRTAWVYSPYGGNFLKTMLKAMGEKGEVTVVADQIGTPTSAATLADALWGLCQAGAKGVHHHTDAGVASWYDFAQAIAEDAPGAGLLKTQPKVLPIRTEDYPTPARRPAFSVLDKTSTWTILGRPSPHWRCAMRTVLQRLASSG